MVKNKMTKKGKYKEKLKENFTKSTIEGASAEILQRYGAANKEHIVSFTGIDNETGKHLTKSLDSISKHKVNPEYEYQNLHQQAGFSAEVKETARTNAENIIAGKKERKVRTDDIGRVNDPQYDHVLVDENGNIIHGSGSQMKFIGASENDPSGIGAPAKTLNKLQSQKFEKYLKGKGNIEVPSDYYDEMQAEADKQIAKLKEQADVARKKGNAELVKQKEQKISKLKTIKSKLKPSKVSSKDAMFARLHPKLSTAIDIWKISHRAGLESAKTSAVIGGTVSMVQNLVLVCKGEIETKQALKNVAKDATYTAFTGYTTGFAGSAVKGFMQNSANSTLRSLSKTNLPATLVTCSISVSKSLKRYYSGEISGVECFQELGEQGTGMISSAMFATIGQAVIPVPIVGAMIGSMVGYTVSSASYGLLLQALKEKELAHERRVKIEKECEEHIKLIKEYRMQMEMNIQKYLGTHMVIFNNAFRELKSSLDIGDVDGFISNTNTITKTLGKEVQFNTFNEFDKLMQSDTALKL